MTTSEIISISSLLSGLCVAVIRAFYKQNAKISKMEGHAEVCNERHARHDARFLKQDEINLQQEKNHVEVMTALSRIDVNIEYLKLKQ